MNDATTGTYRIAFDTVLGVEPLTIPAPTTVEDIAQQVRDAFKPTEFDVTSVEVDLDGGQVTIANEDGDPWEWATITHTPDYWLTLADAVRQHADRIATLAGVELKPNYVGLSIQVAGPGDKNPVAGDTVDVIADAFGLTAETGRTATGQFWERRANGKLDSLNFQVYAYVPAPQEPEDPEKAALRAEVEALRAQLAEGGAR